MSPLTTGLIFGSFAIGGGTPSLLTVPQLGCSSDTVALFGMHPSHTFTSVETSPGYADPACLDLLKQAGVARVSIGVQSFLDEGLTALKRRPRQDMVNQVLEAIRKRQSPFSNIDLIYGVKGQTVANFLYSLEQAPLFQSNELFIYPLYVRPGTAITERESDDVCFQMYCAACDLLKGGGFLQTSMRRFIRHPPTDTEISRGDEVMLLCGPDERSHLDNLHYVTRYTVCQCCTVGEIDGHIGTTSFTVARNGFILLQEERRQRFIIKNLMYHIGLDRAGYKRRFGESLDNVPLFRQLTERQQVEDTDSGRVCLTSNRMVYFDCVGQLFITPEIRELVETYSC